MAIYHAVLGLLTEGPSYGYELKARFQRAIGPQWGDLNIGHMYQVLDRLVRDGYVTSRVHPQTARPDRVVYRLTKQGRDELDSWLGNPSVRQAGYRDDFFLKLFVASRAGADRLHDVARLQREASLAELADLAHLRRAHRDDPLISLLIEAAILHTKANARIAEEAEQRAAQLVRHTSGEAGRIAPEVGEAVPAEEPSTA